MLRSLAIAALALCLACDAARAPAPPAGPLQAQLEEAAARYGVPAPLLLAVAWVDSRLSMHAGVRSPDGAYGLFHLVDRGDAPEALSLSRAAQLTGLSPHSLRADPGAHALGFAALLREQADRVFAQYRDLDEHRLGDWYEVVMLSSGLDDARQADGYASQVFQQLRDGFVAAADDGSPVRLRPQAFSLEGRALLGQLEQGLSGEYCPSGCVDFVPASTSNYTAGRGGLSVDHIIIHDMEGSYASAIAWFQNPSAAASAHYDVRSVDGQITQQVHNGDTAWHAGNWNINERSIGIEHEGFAAEGTRWFTEAMYRSSAALVRWLSDKYGVVKDRSHIIGHYEVPDPNHAGWYGGAGHHHDPCHTWAGDPTWHNVAGCDWDWAHFMDLVTGGAPPPVANGTLTGFVGDACCGLAAGTRVPLVGATVVLQGGSQSARSDAQGWYTFSLPAGSYTPQASLAGYVTADHSSVGAGFPATLQVASGATVYGSILLKKQVVAAPPAISISAPANGATVSATPVLVQGAVDDASIAQVKVNGNSVTTAAGAFSTSVALLAGRNAITVTATNANGTGSAQVAVTYEPPPPPPPAQGAVAGRITASSDGHAIQGATVTAGQAAPATSDATGAYRLVLPPGTYALTVAAQGFAGETTTVTLAAGQVAPMDFALEDAGGPPQVDGSITLITPPDGIETQDDAVLVTGKAQMAGLASVLVDDAPAALDASGNFSAPAQLIVGANTIVVRAVDGQGRSVQTSVHVLYTPAAPPVQHVSATGCASGPAGAWALLGALALLARRRRQVG
jgi:MYXO-CTERM domain-containing protein